MIYDPLKILRIYLFVVTLLVVISFSYNIDALAEPSQFPDWLKSTAKSWGEGQMSDNEFIKVLQWLVDQNLITIPESENDKNQNLSEEGFSNITCKQEYKYVRMTGKYTNGETPYSIIFLRMVITNSDGNIIETGSGLISDIDAYRTKYFDVISRYSDNFTSCTVQIDGTIPKSR